MRLLDFLRRLNGHSFRFPVWPARLVDCDRCGSEFVNPVAWHALDDWHWWVRLRCGQCGAVREVELTDGEAADLDRELDRGVADIAATIARIQRDGAEAILATLRAR